jgi:hypothetical protein
MKRARSIGSLSRPSSSTGRWGHFSNKIRAKTAVEVLGHQLVDLLMGVGLHPLGQILTRFRLHQTGVFATLDEPDGRPRHAEADVELWAHRHPLEPLAEHVGEVAVALVAAVETDLGAEQTG